MLLNHPKIEEIHVPCMSHSGPSSNGAKSQYPGIVFSSLRYLHLEYRGGGPLQGSESPDLSAFLASFLIPKLKIFHFSIISSHDVFPIDRTPPDNFPDGLLTCFTNSRPPLEVLSLLRVQMPTDFFHRFQKLFPQLEHFSAEYFANYRALELLNLSRFPEHFPKMKHLSLQGYIVTPEMIRNIMES